MPRHFGCQMLRRLKAVGAQASAQEHRAGHGSASTSTRRRLGANLQRGGRAYHATPQSWRRHAVGARCDGLDGVMVVEILAGGFSGADAWTLETGSLVRSVDGIMEMGDPLHFLSPNQSTFLCRLTTFDRWESGSQPYLPRHAGAGRRLAVDGGTCRTGSRFLGPFLEGSRHGSQRV
jgi:hypothetical protein